MKHLFILLSIWVGFTAFSQVQLPKTNISAGGGSQNNADKQIIYTVGETTVNEIRVNNRHLSEGFIGPDLLQTLKIENFSVLSNIRIYPNPVINNVFLKLPQGSYYEIYIYDLNGKLLIKTKSDNPLIELNLSQLQPEIYLLYIIDRTHKKYTIKKIEKS